MDEQAIKAHEIDVPCPKCLNQKKKSLGWLKDHNYITCGRLDCRAVYPINKQLIRETIKQLKGLPINGIVEPRRDRS
jgi:hypothetical protein